ncbi:MAG: dockerin type I repeat-containing protein, partial [Oscillospiraceae bacterium]
AGTKAMNLSVYSTERNPETGEIGKWLTASSGIREVEETDSGKIVNYPAVSNGGGADGFGKQGFVTFDYTGDSNILYFEAGMDGVGGGFYSYNMYTGEISNFQPILAHYDVPVAEKFDVSDGYESVTVYALRPESNYNITDINVPEDKITATPYVKYETVIGETNSTDPDKLVKENGYIIDVDIDGELININGIIGGKFLANIPYATNLTSFSETYAETIPEIVGDGNGSDVYAYEETILGDDVSIQNFAKETAIDEYHSDWRDTPVILGEGAYEERVRPVAVDSASGNWIETSNHGNVYLLKEVFPTSDVNGDVNSDGVLSVLDLVAQQRYLHNTATYQAENFINGDFNHDGNVDIFDLALMKRTLLQ